MNCSLPAGDIRTKEDMVRDCDECIAIEKYPTYKLLSHGDKIEIGDQALQSDAVTWVSAPDWAIGMRINLIASLPYRRPVR